MKKFTNLFVIVSLLSSLIMGIFPARRVSASDEEVTIAFIPQLIGIPYFTAMEEGGNLAAEEFGVNFLYTGSVDVNAAEQVQIMDSLIRQGVNAIGVSVLDSSSINPIIQKAKEEGISVFTSDSDSPDSEREVYVAQALDQDLGYTLIDRLAAQIGEEGQIGIVSGDPTATNLNAWITFMEERIAAEYPNIEVVDIRYATTSEDSLRQAQELMTRYPDLKGLIAVASINIPGVAQAVEQSGQAGEINVIGYGSPETVKPYIESGVMQESVLWDAKQLGYLAVWAGLQLVEGNEFEASNEVPGLDQPIEYLEEEQILLLGPPLIIDANNVNDFDF